MPCPLRVFTKYQPTTYKRVIFQDENIEANGAIVSLVNEDTINFNFLLNTSDVPGKLLNLSLEKYFVYQLKPQSKTKPQKQ